MIASIRMALKAAKSKELRVLFTGVAMGLISIVYLELPFQYQSENPSCDLAADRAADTVGGAAYDRLHHVHQIYPVAGHYSGTAI